LRDPADRQTVQGSVLATEARGPVREVRHPTDPGMALLRAAPTELAAGVPRCVIPPIAPVPPAGQTHPFVRRRGFGWLTRARRVLLALAAVWVLNIFDLGFTLVESSHGHFTELNPIAASILSRPDYFLIAFKLGLLTLGSIILLVLREHRLAELGCWLLLAAYLYVGARWYAYYYCLLDGGRSTFVEVLAVMH
jgi:hypothetical protein